MTDQTEIVESILFSQDDMTLITNRGTYVFALDSISQKLLQATATERSDYRLSPSGYGIHWPSIDEDLSVPGLLSSNQRLH